MSGPGFWERLKQARMVQVLIAYLVASWVVLQVAEILQESLSLPDWVLPTAILLLLIGLIIIMATAWVQAHPHTERREEAGEVPGSWAIAPKDLGQSLRQGRLPHLTWGRSILGGVFALWFLFGLAGVYLLIQDRGESFVPPEAIADEAGEGIAVVPFTVRGPDLEVWREGMVDLLATSLDGVGGYRTIDSRTVMARWREVAGDDEAPDLETTLEVARRSGASYVLTGSAVAIGDNVRLAADIYDTASGSEVAEGQVEGAADAVLHLVDELAVEVMGDLFREGDSELLSRHQAASVTTSSLPALKAYLEGEAAYRSADFAPAIDAFERAIAEDSTFALAYYRLSDAYGWMEGIQSERSLDNIEIAAGLAERLRPRDQLILAGTRSLLSQELDGVDLLREATQKYPDDPEAWFGLGEWYVHYGGELLVGPEEVSRVLTQAVELDPTFAPYYLHLIESTIHGRDSVRTAELLETYLELDPDGRESQALTIAAPLFLGDSASHVDALSRLDGLDPEVLSFIWFDVGWPGGLPSALESVARTLRAKNGGWGGAVHRTLIAQGKAEEAIAWAEDAPNPGARASDLLWVHRYLKPLPDDLLEAITLSACGSGENLGLGCTMGTGSLAADRGEWREYDSALEALRGREGELLAEGDSARAGFLEFGGAWLSAYGEWRRGRADVALRAFRDLQGRRSGIDVWARWALAELYAETGRSREATRYFESLIRSPLYSYSRYRLCGLYDELGDEEAARDACEAFLRAWEHADPDLPQLAEAREVLTRLWGEPIESAAPEG